MAGSDPLIVLVHVPKTAGTSMITALEKCVGPGARHIENLLGQPAAMRKRIAASKWVSGHIPVDRLRARISEHTQRPAAFFGTVRDPAAQVASHYNWLIEIGRRTPEFFDRHPARIKDMSRHIAATDNSDPAAVIANLDAYAGMFLNAQSRYLLGAAFDWAKSDPEPVLRAYDYIATSSNIAELLRRWSITESPDAFRVNTSPYHFAPEVFDDPAMRSFLKRRNAQDHQVYDLVQRLF